MVVASSAILALIQSPAKYIITSGGAVFILSINLGNQPVHPANATTPIITKIN
jgi:hypothetical protein